MTMSIDPQQQRFGGMNFDMPYQHSPQFTNPWSSAPSQTHSLYASAHQNLSPMGLKQEPQQHQHSQRLNSHVPMGTYASVPVTSASADLLSPNRAVSMGYGSNSAYSSAPSPVHNYAPTPTPYEAMGYAPAPLRTTYALPQHQDSRRLSQPGLQQESTRGFGDAIDASRGMIAMGQQDQTTPRNIYGVQPRQRGSGDAYGFPTQHSTSSSMSSQGSYPSYYGSVDSSSVSDYSNGSDMETGSSRTLPRPSGLLSGGMPPAPQSMMGQFSSKVSSSTQKKHKCKVCDKRFTRPSSLQTHMYSHTGEKPFSCEVEGCGRHFSVVSNLRRHRKVHKGDAQSEVGSEDHHSDD